MQNAKDWQKETNAKAYRKTTEINKKFIKTFL